MPAKPPAAVYVKLPLSAERAEQLAELARLAPDAIRVGRALFGVCSELLTAVEKDVYAAAAHVARRRKRKLPRARKRDR